jgi:uncharacterized protein
MTGWVATGTVNAGQLPVRMCMRMTSHYWYEDPAANMSHRFEQPPMKHPAVGDPDGRLRLHQAAVAGNADDVARLISDEGEDVAATDRALLTPLHVAAQQGHLEAARALLDGGAPVDAPDSYGNTPLWKAIFAFQGGDPALLRLLLKAGADPDSKNNTDRSPRDVALTFDRPGIRSVFP